MGTQRSTPLMGASGPREADVLRLAIDIARQIAAGEPFKQDLVRRIEVVLAADGGCGLASFSPDLQPGDGPDVVASEGCVVLPGQAERAAQYVGTHPSFAAMFQFGATRPIRTSDHVRMDAFWETEEFDAMHGWMPTAHYPASIALHVGPTGFAFLGLHRDRRDFTEDDLDALALIQSIVAPALTLNARLEEATSRLRALALDGAGAIGGDQLTALTRREEQVLALAAGGLTSGAIAHRLGLSERTVRKHLSSVYAKTGLRGRAAATAWWAAQGRRRLDSTPPRARTREPQR
ncbi:LuxR C-terminal-related transcriptional regulator [Terrabacter sp. 2RAF25]|uniref:helix-turn-helix transcriptional regulator n=1 Tax=Terrabacter sp. 2RAF25 TaxID=3232998 RepID=UPI003F9B0BAA